MFLQNTFSKSKLGKQKKSTRLVQGSTFVGLVFDGSSISSVSSRAINTGGSFDDFTDFIIKLINVVLLYVGIIAVLVVILAGVTFIISGGNEELRSRAKKAIIYSIIGLIIIIFAKVIVEIFTILLT